MSESCDLDRQKSEGPSSAGVAEAFVASGDVSRTIEDNLNLHPNLVGERLNLASFDQYSLTMTRLPESVSTTVSSANSITNRPRRPPFKTQQNPQVIRAASYASPEDLAKSDFGFVDAVVCRWRELICGVSGDHLGAIQENLERLV